MRKIFAMAAALAVCAAAQAGRVLTDSIRSQVLGEWVKYNVYVPDGFDRSFAELSAAEKNAISHRGRALAEARRIIAGEG